MNQSPIKPEQARTDRHVEAFLRALNAADAPRWKVCRRRKPVKCSLTHKSRSPLI